MNREFAKFPHTPHLAWLGSGQPRDDKVLSPAEAAEVLSGEVVIEEKIDGANLGLSVGPDGRVRAQNRGDYVRRGGHPQYDTLWPWMDRRQADIADALGGTLILFGEWCFARHSVRYTALSDWFLAFDVYDRVARRFWSVARRDELAALLSLAVVPQVACGRFLNVSEVARLFGRSHYADGPMEGLYIRRDDGDWLACRAKLVRPQFAQAIGEHWSKRQQMERNALLTTGATPYA